MKSLVDAMGGTVTVRNVAGAGAGEILVAEDNDDNFAIVERHLTNQGYRVERAVNGIAAVAAAARRRFDLVLMDVEMPEMDGLKATRLIR